MYQQVPQMVNQPYLYQHYPYQHFPQMVPQMVYQQPAMPQPMGQAMPLQPPPNQPMGQPMMGQPMMTLQPTMIQPMMGQAMPPAIFQPMMGQQPTMGQQPMVQPMFQPTVDQSMGQFMMGQQGQAQHQHSGQHPAKNQPEPEDEWSQSDQIASDIGTMAQKMHSFELRHAQQAPDATASLRFLEQWAEGSLWGLSSGVITSLEDLIRNQCPSYGHCMSQCDLRRGQFEVLRQIFEEK